MAVFSGSNNKQEKHVTNREDNLIDIGDEHHGLHDDMGIIILLKGLILVMEHKLITRLFVAL